MEQLIEKLPMFNALVAVLTQLLLGMVVQIDPAVPLLVSTCPDTPAELFIWKIPLMFVIMPVLPIVTEVALVVPSKREVEESIAKQLIEKLPMFNGLVAVLTQLLLGMVVQIDPAVPLLVSTCPDTPDELFI